MAYKQTIKRKKEKTSYSVTNDIIAYENGELDSENTIKLFQKLEDNGLAYQLQGSYGRTAVELVGAGLIKPNMKYHSPEQVKSLKQKYELNKDLSFY